MTDETAANHHGHDREAKGKSTTALPASICPYNISQAFGERARGALSRRADERGDHRAAGKGRREVYRIFVKSAPALTWGQIWTSGGDIFFDERRGGVNKSLDPQENLSKGGCYSFILALVGNSYSRCLLMWNFQEFMYNLIMYSKSCSATSDDRGRLF